MRLGLHTGMRKGEMLGLEWSRVDLTEGLVYLGREHQKNGKLGSVPLNGEARQAILARATFRTKHCPGSPWVFCSKDGGRIQNVKHGFASACVRAGLKNFRPHDLRHTCAAWLVQAGVSIREVAELLRHSDIRITMCYAHLAPGQVRAVVERLEPFTSHSGHTIIRQTPTPRLRLILGVSVENGRVDHTYLGATQPDGALLLQEFQRPLHDLAD